MPDPWPRSARWTSAGLAVGGLAAADLAERFGTPLLVIDEADMRGRKRRSKLNRLAIEIDGFLSSSPVFRGFAGSLALLKNKLGFIGGAQETHFDLAALVDLNRHRRFLETVGPHAQRMRARRNL